MKIRLLTLLVVLLLLSCASPFVEMSTDIGYSLEDLHASPPQTPYARVYQALYETLQWYTYPSKDGNGGVSEYPAVVHETDWPERQFRRMYVHSRINADADTKTRIEIVGMVIQDKYNEITPMIYVWHQMEPVTLSEARPAAGPSLLGSANNSARWVNIARNERMEARLLNVVYQRLEGGNQFSGRFGLDSRPWVEWVPEEEPVPDAFLPETEGNVEEEE